MWGGWKHIKRLSVGALAGITAAVVKYWTHDHASLMNLIELQQNTKVVGLLFGYGIGAGILLFLGAIAAWISQEDDVRKLFFIGLSAPSLFAAGIPPAKAEQSPAKLEQISFISSAYAQDAKWTSSCVGDSSVEKGFKVFFGIPQDKFDKARVVVGSFKDPQIASAKAKEFAAKDPSLKWSVGPRRCDNDYYPIVVGDPLPIPDAKKLKEKVQDSGFSDAYVSPGPS
jgi:hypothetical protein